MRPIYSGQASVDSEVGLRQTFGSLARGLTCSHNCTNLRSVMSSDMRSKCSLSARQCLFPATSYSRRQQADTLEQTWKTDGKTCLTCVVQLDYDSYHTISFAVQGPLR